MTHRAPQAVLALVISVTLVFPALAAAADARIAVASNFLAPAQALAEQLKAGDGFEVELVSGASGKLYAQVLAGAPFDALLSADRERPERLEREGHAVPGTRFSYALGRLVLWSADPALVDAAGTVLETGRFRHLAIANPDSAPYGLAAAETLRHLGLLERLQPRLVRGDNIAQAFQFVASGNAELGFVALAQLQAPGAEHGGSQWRVPADHHAPIDQQAVLLRDVPAARAYLALLRAPVTREWLRGFGYDVPDDR